MSLQQIFVEVSRHIDWLFLALGVTTAANIVSLAYGARLLRLIKDAFANLSERQRLRTVAANRAYDDMALLLALRMEERTAAVHELDRVTILAAKADRGGVEVPAGSTGTVVAVLKGGAAYIVEFTSPVAAVVTVRPGELMPAEERD